MQMIFLRLLNEDRIMNIFASITGIKYTPLLCTDLEDFGLNDFDKALATKAVFALNIDKENRFVFSWWVSPKRTRSYPYARVYNSLGFGGKRVTVIPVMKDEGKEGDRDFLQWDSVSLMSLLGVYVVISYYSKAERSERYRHKITNQRFDSEYTISRVKELLSYHSDALHWNIEQLKKIGEIGQNALESYEAISEELDVKMHSYTSAEKRIEKLNGKLKEFMDFSRVLAEKAQGRERLTKQPKENLSGEKATITIKNYLGGNYYFTSDEARIEGQNIYLSECKHSEQSNLPSLDDIKDGLVKMILFTNLKQVQVEGKKYNPIPILKLTSGKGFSLNNLSESQRTTLTLLRKEADKNNFQLLVL